MSSRSRRKQHLEPLIIEELPNGRTRRSGQGTTENKNVKKQDSKAKDQTNHRKSATANDEKKVTVEISDIPNRAITRRSASGFKSDPMQSSVELAKVEKNKMPRKKDAPEMLTSTTSAKTELQDIKRTRAKGLLAEMAPVELQSCPTPGCDGKGHSKGKYARHRSSTACPIATNKRCLDSPVSSDIASKKARGQEDKNNKDNLSDGDLGPSNIEEDAETEDKSRKTRSSKKKPVTPTKKMSQQQQKSPKGRNEHLRHDHTALSGKRLDFSDSEESQVNGDTTEGLTILMNGEKPRVDETPKHSPVSTLNENEDSMDTEDDEQKVFRETERALRQLSGEWDEPPNLFASFGEVFVAEEKNVSKKKKVPTATLR